MPTETQETTTPDVPVKGGVTPYLTVDGAAKAAEFYKKALGAVEAFRMPGAAPGKEMHIHLYINDTSVMLSDPFPEHGHPWTAPAGFSLNLQVDDTDAWYDRAVKAGAEPIMPPEDMFWGARYAQAKDPFGVLWAFNQPKR
jgi:uncharacterized glyoxalase superfamily protein PhnB